MIAEIVATIIVMITPTDDIKSRSAEARRSIISRYG